MTNMCIYSFNISLQTIVQLCFTKLGFTGLKQIEAQLIAALGWFKMQESQKFYPGTSFSEEIYLVMQENAKKVEKSYH